MGENIKAVFAEDEEKSKPENLENVEKRMVLSNQQKKQLYSQLHFKQLCSN